jgi:protein LSM14
VSELKSEASFVAWLTTSSKPFQVISRLNVRYTGIFQGEPSHCYSNATAPLLTVSPDIDQETQTLCLSEVYNHGTEDRPSERVLPGSSDSLGWVRFQ